MYVSSIAACVAEKEGAVLARIQEEVQARLTAGAYSADLVPEVERVVSTRILMLTKRVNQEIANAAEGGGMSKWPAKDAKTGWEWLTVADALQGSSWLKLKHVKTAVSETYCVDTVEKTDAVHLLHEHNEGLRLERRRAAAMKEEEEEEDEFDFEEADGEEDLMEECLLFPSFSSLFRLS